MPDKDLEEPLGGADKTLLKLVRHLAKEHEVEVYTNLENGNPIYLKRGNATFHQHYEMFHAPKQECDVYIHYRKVWLVNPNMKAKKMIFYSQDTLETGCFDSIKKQGVEWFDQFDTIIALSKFHKKDFTDMFPQLEPKIVIVGNAADKPTTSYPKSIHTFLYASTPYRGLISLLPIWDKWIESHPDDVLHVCSSMAIYGAKYLDELEYATFYKTLKNTKGIQYHASVKIEELYKYYQQSFLLLYPNTYAETYCNVIAEAKACGTPFITSNKGALPETGGKAGLYIDGNPRTPYYKKDFLEAMEKVRANPSLYTQLQENCKDHRTWKDYYKDIDELIA